MYDLCKAVGFLAHYSMWNVQLSVALMTVEVFLVIVLSVELRKAEIPLLLASFTLPVAVPVLSLCIKSMGHVPFCSFVRSDSGSTDTSAMQHFVEYNVIPGIAVTGIGIAAILIALLCLVYRNLRLRFTDRNCEEEQYLFTQRTRRRYGSLLKETFPFIVYPLMSQIAYLIYYLYLLQECNAELNYVHLLMIGSVGSLPSLIFFVHLKTLGHKRRNVFMKRSRRDGARSNWDQPVNEGERLTEEGSITCTNVTQYYPPGESDIKLPM